MAPGSKPIILVVDDTPENIDVMKGALIGDYQIRPAPNGQIALKAANILPLPDLVLLDIMMPGMDGYEVCRRLKADPVTQAIPIIFVTAKTEAEDEVAGLHMGAVDYITKPFSVPIVRARVKTHLALRTATQKLDEHNQRLTQERELVENIILKMRHADLLDERHLRYLVSPVDVTAGDMLFSTFTPDGRQLVLLGDFTGHGLPAAMAGPLVSYIFHELGQQGNQGETILQEINRQLCLRLPTWVFFAATMLEISPDRRQVNHWNAGMPEALLMRHQGDSFSIQAHMLPLGIANDLTMSAATTEMAPGDRWYVFSDGIIEAKDRQQQMFGLPRLKTFLERVVAGDHHLDDLIPLLNEYVGSSVHEDDITMVEITI